MDLFEIEGTNRDSIINPGPNHVRQDVVQNGQVVPAPGSDDVLMPSRFNVPTQYIPAGQGINAPESYGFVSGMLPSAQSRGIGTLPGGIPLFKTVTDPATGKPVTAEVGGIGVFFPGTTGFASAENSKLNEHPFRDPTKPDRSREAEYVAFVAAGGSSGGGISFTGKRGASLGLPAFTDGSFDLPSGRIDLVGITLNVFGAHGRQGVKNMIDAGAGLGLGDTLSGTDEPIAIDQSAVPASAEKATNSGTLGTGQDVPSGWLVTPHDAQDGSGLTAADVNSIIDRGIAEANQIRAAIRLPLDSTAKMVFSVTDKSGNILGLYRMNDATVFSIDVAVAKARNVTYYADPAQLQPQDMISNSNVPPGTAFTNRGFRYLAEPRYPEGIDGNPPGPFSILNEDTIGITGSPLPASSFQTVQGFDAFNPQTNFHQPWNLNQNGIVFFPGSSPLYKDTGSGKKVLVGGLGVSGDGVDQDDDVTFEALTGFSPTGAVRRSDQVFVRARGSPTSSSTASLTSRSTSPDSPRSRREARKTSSPRSCRSRIRPHEPPRPRIDPGGMPTSSWACLHPVWLVHPAWVNRRHAHVFVGMPPDGARQDGPIGRSLPLNLHKKASP